MKITYRRDPEPCSFLLIFFESQNVFLIEALYFKSVNPIHLSFKFGARSLVLYVAVHINSLGIDNCR